MEPPGRRPTGAGSTVSLPALGLSRPRDYGQDLRFYHFANRLLRRLVFPPVLKIELRGLENVPRTGPLLVAINHSSFLDPILVGAYFPRDVIMMSKVENMRNPLYGWLVRLYGAFPVRRGEADTQAVKIALRLLRRGQAVLMAPEGTRSPDGRLQAGRPGTVLLARRTGALVLPTAIWEPQRLWYNLARLRRTPVTLAVGQPIRFQEGGDRETLQAQTDRLMLRLAELLPPELRGPYGNAEEVRTV